MHLWTILYRVAYELCLEWDKGESLVDFEFEVKHQASGLTLYALFQWLLLDENDTYKILEQSCTAVGRAGTSGLENGFGAGTLAIWGVFVGWGVSHVVGGVSHVVGGMRPT